MWVTLGKLPNLIKLNLIFFTVKVRKVLQLKKKNEVVPMPWNHNQG